MTLKQYMGEFWQHKFGALVWWIAARYVCIGIEYVLEEVQSSSYWLFDGLKPWVIGVLMVFVGALGLWSRWECRDGWSKPASNLTMLFAIGVCVHSFFRLAMFFQSHLLGDPLVVLFTCDLVAMFSVLVQILRANHRQCPL